jgi:hypothetical protein
MQSSFMNLENARLKEAIHSERLSFSGDSGAWPARASRSVALDNAKATELGHGVAFASAPEDQPRGRADSSRQEKSHSESAGRDDRQIRAEPPRDVGRFADLFTEAVGRAGELLAFDLDVVANLVDRA